MPIQTVKYDLVVIGGGIVGLATALAIQKKYPNLRLAVIEKENDWGAHQTGHNSGVIHSGIYYNPGTLKATLAKEGNAAMAQFCRTQGLPFAICGKLIVATQPKELSALKNLYEQGQANGLTVRWLSGEEAKESEPHLTCLSAIHVASTGIVDFRQVARRIADLLESGGAALHCAAAVMGIASRGPVYILETKQGVVECKFLVNCGGLFSDRLALMSGAKIEARIVPFRGEYYELIAQKRHLVNHLIYPVPDPDLPFLGVHLTRGIDGGVHAGPNAVPSLKREGYRKADFNWRDAFETLAYPGFWKLVRRYSKTGIYEMLRSFSKVAMVRSLQRLVPELQPADLVPSAAGVRAQALKPDGQLMNDFYLLADRRAIHVCNAPSPAATASIPIGRYIADQIPDPLP